MNIDISKVAEIIKDVALTEILPKFKNLNENEISQKSSDFDLVTIVDKKSEQLLSKHLNLLLPDSKILGEEAIYSDPSLKNLVDSEGYVWIIDPLDGTNNFTKGKENFGVIISLLKDKESIAGWIYTPIKNMMMMAEKGSGVYANGNKVKISPRKKEISEYDALFDFEYANLDKIVKSLDHLWCSAAEYQMLVNNEKDIGFFCGELKPWDHSAGLFLHQEAGGYNSFLDGTPYNHKGVDLKNNPLLLAPDKEIWLKLKQKIIYKK